MTTVQIDGTLKPRGLNIFPTHDASWGIGGYRTTDTYAEMVYIPREFLTEGCLCFCNETQKEYRYLSGEWAEKVDCVIKQETIVEKVTEVPVTVVEKVIEKEPQIVEKTLETKTVVEPQIIEQKVIHVNEEKDYKGLVFSENCISLRRSDGTKAFEISLNEDEDAEMVFFDKKGMAVGVFNPTVFE